MQFVHTKPVRKLSELKTKLKTKFKSGGILRGALLLGAGGVVAKFLGVFYRIPLTNLIGAEGMGLYQMVFPFYTLLLTVSSSGLPTAISRLVAERLAENDAKGAKAVFHTALKFLAVSGFLASLLVVALYRTIARLQGNENAAPAYLGIAPALFLVALISAFRGYFQGRRKMLPTALSQITEQAVKLGAGLLAAYFLLPYGAAYAALGALIGVSLSEAAALAQLWVQYLLHRRRESDSQFTVHNAQLKDDNEGQGTRDKRQVKDETADKFPSVGGVPAKRTGWPTDENTIDNCQMLRNRAYDIEAGSLDNAQCTMRNAQLKDDNNNCEVCIAKCALNKSRQKQKRAVLKKLLAVSIPITLGAMILPITQLIDSALVINLLRRGGYPVGLSTALYGIVTGPVMSIVNMPVILSLAFATGAVPVFAAMRVKGDAEGMRRQIGRGLRATVVFGLPCAILVGLCSGPIISVLYGGGLKGGGAGGVNERLLAAQLLTLSALDVFFIAVMQTATAFLQAAGKTYLPVRNLAVGAALKVVLNLWLITRPGLHIYGAAISTAVCYASAALLDIVSVRNMGKSFSRKIYQNMI